MAKDPKISVEDSLLFRESIGAVRRLKQDKVAIKPARPTAKLRRTTYSTQDSALLHDPISEGYQSAESELNGAATEFVRPGVQQGVLRKLRRGQFDAELTLDLHGLTVTEARTALLHFLHHCRDQAIRHVRIIHGQGNSSHLGRPVLKGKVPLWLQQLEAVLAFCPARTEHGGAGALYVLLKRYQK